MSKHVYRRSVNRNCKNVVTGQTETVISDHIIMYKDDAGEFSVYFNIEDFSGTEMIVCIQSEVRQGIWCDVGDVASVCVDQNGDYGILLSHGVEIEALVLPLAVKTRLVAKTDGTVSATVNEIVSHGGNN